MPSENGPAIAFTRKLRCSMLRSIRANAPARHRAAIAIAIGVRVAVAAAAAGSAITAVAHGFGQLYDLPLPLSLYLFATAAAVVFSFVVAALFMRRAPRSLAYPRVDLLVHPLGRLIAHPALALALKLISLVLFVVAIAAGFGGNQNPYQNIAPTLVWIVGWVGLAYVSAFVGNLWVLINPWRTLFERTDSLYRRLGGARGISLRLPYPEKLGVWPAFALLLVFSWIELVYPSPALPAHIAWLAVGYSALTWTGMFVYSSEAWLRHGEVFSVVFAVFARFAPTEARVVEPSICNRCPAHCRNLNRACIDCYDCYRRAGPRQRELALRPFAAGVLASRPPPASVTAPLLFFFSPPPLPRVAA